MSEFVVICGNYVRVICPYSFAFFILDYVISNVISLLTGNGIVLRPFRVGRFRKGSLC